MLLLSLCSYGVLKFPLLHREKVSHSCLCTLATMYHKSMHEKPPLYNCIQFWEIHSIISGRYVRRANWNFIKFPFTPYVQGPKGRTLADLPGYGSGNNTAIRFAVFSKFVIVLCTDADFLCITLSGITTWFWKLWDGFGPRSRFS